MATRLILYDFGPEERPAEGPVGEDVYFPAQPLVQRCLGCFGCWVKTPGRCVLQDRASVLPELLKHCDEWIILSPIVYGGYSVCVKAAIERCLGYLSDTPIMLFGCGFAFMVPAWRRNGKSPGGWFFPTAGTWAPGSGRRIFGTRRIRRRRP